MQMSDINFGLHTPTHTLPHYSYAHHTTLTHGEKKTLVKQKRTSKIPLFKLELGKEKSNSPTYRPTSQTRFGAEELKRPLLVPSGYSR